MFKAQDGKERKPRTPRPSVRKAVTAYCKACIYDPLSGHGTWRQQVEGCTATKCELWPVRPKSTGSAR